MMHMKKHIRFFILTIGISSGTLFAAESEKSLPLYPPGPSLTPRSKEDIKWYKMTDFLPKQLYLIVARDHWETIQSFLDTKAFGVPFIHGAYSRPGSFSWNSFRPLNLQTTTQYDPLGADKWCIKLVKGTQVYRLLERCEKQQQKPHTILEVKTEELMGYFTKRCLEEDFFGRRVPRDELTFYSYTDLLVPNSLPLRAVTEVSATERDAIDADEWVYVSTENQSQKT